MKRETARDEDDAGLRKPEGPLRRGWTTGACATAAAKAALTALFTGSFPDPVTITLPKGEKPSFALAREHTGPGWAEAGIVKDAGDDPDVTHGVTVIARVELASPGNGIHFTAGDGVGIVTRAGLPVPPGEPAINPAPRAMIAAAIEEVCAACNKLPDVRVTISIPGGGEIAKKTWNPRLGIVGGLSVLGTTGIVHPFSCSSWIHSIHRGIDVCRAAGIDHVIAATGSTSEAAAQAIYHLPEIALIDMGDFAGGVLKYLREHPIARITIAGGFAKLTKLAQGATDLHSARSQVDMAFLWLVAERQGLNRSLKNRILKANTAQEVLEIAHENGIELAPEIAGAARRSALAVLKGAPVEVEIIVTGRKGNWLARAGAFDA